MTLARKLSPGVTFATLANTYITPQTPFRKRDKNTGTANGSLSPVRMCVARPINFDGRLRAKSSNK